MKPVPDKPHYFTGQLVKALSLLRLSPPGKNWEKLQAKRSSHVCSLPLPVGKHVVSLPLSWFLLKANHKTWGSGSPASRVVFGWAPIEQPSDCLRVWAWYAPTALPPQSKELSPSPAPPQQTQLQHQFEVRTETRPPNRLGFSRPWTASFGCMSSRWSAQTSGPQGDEGIATQGA